MACNASNLLWSASVLSQEDPVESSLFLASASRNAPHNQDDAVELRQTSIILCSVNLRRWFREASAAATSGTGSSGSENHWDAFQQGGRTARIAWSDFVMRRLTLLSSGQGTTKDNEMLKWKEEDKAGSPSRLTYVLEPLNMSTASNARRSNRQHRAAAVLTPYILERTDAWFEEDSTFCMHLRILAYKTSGSIRTTGEPLPTAAAADFETKQATSQAAQRILEQALNPSIEVATQSNTPGTGTFLLLQQAIMCHVATAVLQDRLRQLLKSGKGLKDSIAFIANGSILPRKSGASLAPMASPPAVPFSAPENSSMTIANVQIELGLLRRYLPKDAAAQSNKDCSLSSMMTTVVTLSGLLIPAGVSLIVGGGYHGKSTLLRAIASGIYNKVPGDGREFCVTTDTAVCCRAEDGRYVNNCNISGFISNLPTPPGFSIDTSHFSTGEASGSTSQAANVMEAIEMQASCLLIDEDVSAANFMARDGRMRALVMDETITPLLYRVNGLFATHGISSIVVVGGVGDWLDVPDQVLLMNQYALSDATVKARSISKQFSHGHVQYAGRGVVHRLPWPAHATPIPRRPTRRFCRPFAVDDSKSRGMTTISLLEGGCVMSFHNNQYSHQATTERIMTDDDEVYRSMDLSRCEQLLGKKPQLYGCGLCALWVLRASSKYPELSLLDLLKMIDKMMDEQGFFETVLASAKDVGKRRERSVMWKDLLETTGCAYRPRKYEIGQALVRLRGITFEDVPGVHDDGAAAREAAKEKIKKRQLMEMWNARRKNKLHDSSDSNTNDSKSETKPMEI